MKFSSSSLRCLGNLFDAGTVTGLTDGQLLERFGARDQPESELAFAALLERHGPMVLGVSRKIVRDEHEAEDVFQATFLVLAIKGRSLWVHDSLGPWLHRVACRIAVRANVAAKRRRHAEERGSRVERNRFESSDRDDLTEILDQEVDRLPDRYRSPVILCDLEGRTYEDAARHLGCPVGTVKSRLARGRERLKRQLTRRGLEPGNALPGAWLSGLARESLPAQLAEATTRSALVACSSQGIAAGAVPSAVTALVREMLRMMALARWKSAAVIVLSIGLALGGVAAGTAALAPQTPGQKQTAAAGAAPTIQPKARADNHQPPSYAWNRTDRYDPPNFEQFFPDDLEGAKQLTALWHAKDREQRPETEILDTMRRGLRRADRDTQSEVIRWIGGRYVWGKSPLNPLAVEIMYHATDIPGDPENMSALGHWARYFGISTLQPMTPAVLHTLADSCMQSDEHNNLWRISWGVRDQAAEFRVYLKPYLESQDAATHEKAAAVVKMVSSELNPFVWWRERTTRRVREKFGNQLAAIQKKLQEGTSRERKETFDLIERENIAFIMDGSFLGAVRACALDKNATVRGQAAMHLGLFIPDGQPVSPDALALALQLARDSDGEVSHAAITSGLAGLIDKSDEVIRTLLIHVLSDREQQVYDAVKQGLGEDRERAAKVLDQLIRDGGPEQVKLARSIYNDMTGRAPDGEPKSDPATQAAYAEALRDLHGHLGRVYPSFHQKGIDWGKVGQELIPHAQQPLTQREFGLLVEEMVARLEDSHAAVQAGTAQPPAPDLPRWDPGLACLIDDRGRMVVYFVDPGSPAQKAGVRPGMSVVSINGTPADDAIAQCMNWLKRYIGYSSERALRYDAVRDCVRQQKRGAKVSIVLEQVDGQRKAVEVPALLAIRYLPRLPVPKKGIRDSADLSWVALENGVGFIYVRRIRQGLEAGLDRALEDLASVRGLVIDVRGNSGGGFDANTAFQNFDLSPGRPADSKRPLFKGPIALLIDERTISAGEGWASWFIAKKRARVFGTTTAGASSRKETYTLSNGLYKVVVPVKAYTGFLDRPIERRGLEPDVGVRCNAKDIAQGRDTVVETAAEWLRQAGKD